MIEAKEGKIDVEHFKNIIQKNEVTVIKWGLCGGSEYEAKIDNIYGWILKFFAYYYNRYEDKIMKFDGESIKVDDFNKLANQMLIVPFTIYEEITGKEYLMKYKVGFIGCDQNNKKEVFPVQAWLVSPSTQKERDSIL